MLPITKPWLVNRYLSHSKQERYGILDGRTTGVEDENGFDVEEYEMFKDKRTRNIL